MPLVSVGPETAMMTSILGKMPKMCQFSGRNLAANSEYSAEMSALSILADPSARSAASAASQLWMGAARGGMKFCGGSE